MITRKIRFLLTSILCNSINWCLQLVKIGFKIFLFLFVFHLYFNLCYLYRVFIFWSHFVKDILQITKELTYGGDGFPGGKKSNLNLFIFCYFLSYIFLIFFYIFILNLSYCSCNSFILLLIFKNSENSIFFQ